MQIIKRNGYEILSPDVIDEYWLNQFPMKVDSLILPHLTYYIYECFKSTSAGITDTHLYSKVMSNDVLCYGTCLVTHNNMQCQYYVLFERNSYVLGDMEFVNVYQVFKQKQVVKMFYPRVVVVSVRFSEKKCRACGYRGKHLVLIGDSRNVCGNKNCNNSIISFSKSVLSLGAVVLSLADVLRDYDMYPIQSTNCKKCLTCVVCLRLGEKCRLHRVCRHKDMKNRPKINMDELSLAMMK
jgi:hypothetical protein